MGGTVAREEEGCSRGCVVLLQRVVAKDVERWCKECGFWLQGI